MIRPKITTLLLVFSIFVGFTEALPIEEPIVTLNHGGKVRGSFRYSNMTSTEYFAFIGIPYAEPPIGELRFKATVPHFGWEGVRDGTVTVCPQAMLDETAEVIGTEDCLYLNVYAPKDATVGGKKYPVMVYIHGGAFLFSSGNEDEYNPQLLVAEDVVFVTINYRLGFLGFFSTGDKHAPGNYGIKDSLEALRWIQTNIEAFGGDKDQVTVFGESAGAMLTHYLMLSPLSKGLFHQAIAMSGTAVSALSFQEFPRTKAFDVAKSMNISFDTTEELVQKLMEIDDAKVFVDSTPPFSLPEDIPDGKYPLTFCPSVEPEDSLEERVIPDYPLNLLLKGNFMDIPFILSLTDEESLSAMNEIKEKPGIFEYIESHPETLLPPTWKIQPNSPEASEYIQRIHTLYNNVIQDPYDYTHFVSDHHHNYGAYKAARLHVQKQSSPVYFSTFSYFGDLSHFKIKSNLSKYKGVLHADDLPYLFLSDMFPNVAPNNPAYRIRERMVRIFTNFAKYGDPTKHLGELVNVKWPAMTEGRYVFMNIGEELKVEKDPFGERMEEWWNMDRKFN